MRSPSLLGNQRPGIAILTAAEVKAVDTAVARVFGWRRAIGVYLVFTAGVAVVTWPLVLDPVTQWPRHYDARVFTWVMASMARRLLTDPSRLFHGDAFYPAGESLAYTEVLLPPSLLGLPGFLGGNPILTYNLLLLCLWPLNGLAMAWAAFRLTGSWPAAWLAGTVFCLSPYFTEYYLEFQMLLPALLPVALLAWVRWLETRRGRWLGVALAGLTVQALTTWYYGIILGLGLGALTIGFGCLRWPAGIRVRELLALAAGGLVVGLVLLPFALPYVAVREETGYERSVEETTSHFADLAVFLQPGSRRLFYLFPSLGGVAETSAFVGFTVFALAAASAVWLRRDGSMMPAPAARIGRVIGAALGGAIGLAGVLIVLQPPRFRLGPIVIHARPAGFLDIAVVLGLILLLLRGWAMSRPGGPRRLSEGDWVRLLLLLTGVFVILALGPVIHFRNREIGSGPYLALYHVLLPLHAVRVTTRFAVISIAGLALLAGLGLRALEERLRARPPLRGLVLAGVFVALAFEYAVVSVPYERVTWTPRPVDEILRADPDDVAVLEWPTNRASADADAMFRSLWHGKRVVNGLSGFVPDFIRELSDLLTRSGSPFPVPEAQAALRRIYPLRYLVVRLTDPDLPKEWVPEWLAVRRNAPPLLRFKGTFGDEDLYELVPLPERGVRMERWVSYDFLETHPVARVAIRPLRTGADLSQWVDVLLNGRPVERVPLNALTRPIVTLPSPFHAVAPNVVTLSYGYRRPWAALDARYRIGTTGTMSPGDLRVVSVGQPYGSASSIQLNSVELSPDHRGYNLVALDAMGRTVTADVFDTFLRPQEAHRLAAWVRALEPGTIVVGAVRDEGSGQLTEDAVEALRALGVAGDLRGHFREAHAFVGVKGALPGSALERLGPRPVELAVGRIELVTGRPDTGLGFELTGFALEPSAGR